MDNRCCRAAPFSATPRVLPPGLPRQARWGAGPRSNASAPPWRARGTVGDGGDRRDARRSCHCRGVCAGASHSCRPLQAVERVPCARSRHGARIGTSRRQEARIWWPAGPVAWPAHPREGQREHALIADVERHAGVLEHSARGECGRSRPADCPGRVLMGKTNLHELSLGFTSTNPHFGAVRNPYDPGHIPGGSSGGSGAAVAARMAPLAIAEDTGGSIRNPAACAGSPVCDRPMADIPAASCRSPRQVRSGRSCRAHGGRLSALRHRADGRARHHLQLDHFRGRASACRISS